MRSLSPVQRTIAWLKDQGILCGVVERWIINPKHPAGGVRQDFLGFIDLLAISKADGITGYQVCGSDYSAHRKKILVERRDELREWLEAGGRCVLIGWRKVKKTKGGVQMVWKPRIEEFTLASLENEEIAA